MNATVFLIYNNFLLNYDVTLFSLRTLNEQFHIYSQTFPDRTWPHLTHRCLIQAQSLSLYHLRRQNFSCYMMYSHDHKPSFLDTYIMNGSKISKIHCNTLYHSVDDNLNTKISMQNNCPRQQQVYFAHICTQCCWCAGVYWVVSAVLTVGLQVRVNFACVLPCFSGEALSHVNHLRDSISKFTVTFGRPAWEHFLFPCKLAPRSFSAATWLRPRKLV